MPLRRIAQAALLVALAACGPDPPARPRIVSLSPLGSDILLGVGARDALVAVDAGSLRRPELAGLPSVSLEEVDAYDPDLVLVPRLDVDPAASGSELRARGVDVFVVDPHEIDDIAALAGELGARLGARATGERFARDALRPLALLSAASRGRTRPRVAALVELDPLTLAGGHSLVTDLVEIAGAESVTHGGEERRRRITPEELHAAGADLVLVAAPEPLAPGASHALRTRLAGAHLVLQPLDPSRLALSDLVRFAEELRGHVAPLSREVEPVD